ncbi:natterin-3-like isoform X2 [Syngnathus acus]|uniref:natterin-3-like isoform X2 n=1 Tax=Syngnathus acus TaxID=161584 RepID=UPI001885CB6B|nr:natterin-3-like isoform X2 [Syngnathus acus]
MAKLWVPFLLLASMHLTSCASIDNCDQQPSSSAPANLHPASENKYPEQPPQKTALSPSSDFWKEARDAPSADFDETNLEWERWDGTIPDGAVSIYNSYSSRVDYICKVSCHSGYYDSTLSTAACAYTANGAGYTAEQFDMLVNKDEFEILRWKNGYGGSVTPNSIKTCVNEDTYVGKNEYGLGEVKVSEKVFYLPWGGSHYWYNDYQVLETMKDVKREHLMEVKYHTEGITPIEYPPEVLNKATLVNSECKPIKNEITLTKTVATTRKWDINFSVTVGVGITIETGIPFIVTYRLTKETTYTDTTTHTLTLETRVPPGHSCTVKMQGKKYGLDIPYTARLKRVYRNGETKWTTVTGTFKGLQISEVEAEMERCELLPDVKPC